jgi:hypothetical protein
VSLRPADGAHGDAWTFIVEIAGRPAAVAKLRTDHTERGSPDIAAYQAGIPAAVGERIALPLLLGWFGPGTLRTLPSASCSLFEYVRSIGLQPIVPSTVDVLLSHLCDFYGPCWGRFTDLVGPSGPSRLRPPPSIPPRFSSDLEPLEPAIGGDAFGDASLTLARVVNSSRRWLARCVCSGQPSLLHGDLWQPNVGIEPHRVVLLDWERMVVGNPGADLAHLWLMSPALLAGLGTGGPRLDTIVDSLPGAVSNDPHRRAEVVQEWTLAFYSYLLLEGTRVLWSKLRSTIGNDIPTLTGQTTHDEKLWAAEALARALAVAHRRLAQVEAP